MSQRRWLLMTRSASTSLAMASTPSRALSIRGLHSKRKGVVTIPTVRMPFFFASRAMTGEAPVPVPPPIPVVMNTILVSLSRASRILSMLSSASSRPFLGSPPHPRPGPICKRSGTGESSNDFRSLLHTRKRTSCIPVLYMWPTALHPPPPTPMILMMEGVCGVASVTSRLSCSGIGFGYCVCGSGVKAEGSLAA